MYFFPDRNLKNQRKIASAPPISRRQSGKNQVEKKKKFGFVNKLKTLTFSFYQSYLISSYLSFSEFSK